MNTTQIINWVIAMGIPTALIGFLWRKIKSLHSDNISVKCGVQALLRSQMINDYNNYMEKGYAPIYARDNFTNCYKRYHELGANGVMTDLYNKFMQLPTQAPHDRAE